MESTNDRRNKEAQFAWRAETLLIVSVYDKPRPSVDANGTPEPDKDKQQMASLQNTRCFPRYPMDLPLKKAFPPREPLRRIII